MGAEMNNPQRDLPRALLYGTAVVTVLYLGLNAVYFYGADVTELSGKVEVGLVAGENLFGSVGVMLVTLVLCVSILASASAMVIAGPRVYYAFGRDFRLLSRLSEVNLETGAPTWALLLQGLVTTLIIVCGGIDAIQQYAGFTLGLFASLAVSCVIVLRFTRSGADRPFRAWGYPITPLLFLAVMVWTMYWTLMGDYRREGLLGLATVAVAGVLFYVLAWLFPERTEGSAGE
jgi:APA family basic amino acid/polyamine antiporter